MFSKIENPDTPDSMILVKDDLKILLKVNAVIRLTSRWGKKLKKKKNYKYIIYI
jgi:hypothetical protein